MLSCKEAIRLASEGLDRRLTLRQRIGLRMHVFACRSCSAVRGQLVSIDRIVGARLRIVDATEPGAGPTLAPDAKERIRRAIAKQPE